MHRPYFDFDFLDLTPILLQAKPSCNQPMTTDEGEGAAGPSSLEKRPLSMGEYKRYGRQMILPDFGLGGQLRLKQAKVLIVGAGGLGCPALQYLAAAGVGHITIVDADVVETSNLARQILHTDSRVGMPKAQSAATAARQLNPHIDIVPLCESLSAENAQALVGAHDVVLDCTDNVLTRYLISDAAVLCGKQVVSGAAQGFSGQLVVLHKKLSRESREPIARGPCYRCLYPRAPRPEDVTDCEDGGVLGGVTGLVGTMQALETVKLLARIGDAAEEDEFDTDARNAIDAAPLYMTLINPLDPVPYRSVKLRPRRAATCRSCGDGDLLLAAGLSRIRDLQSEDYVSFCGLAKPSPGGQFEDQEAHISVQVSSLNLASLTSD